jgi:hypothetical protein
LLDRPRRASSGVGKSSDHLVVLAAAEDDPSEAGVGVDHLLGDDRLVHREEVVGPAGRRRQFVDADLAVGEGIHLHLRDLPHAVERHRGDRLDDEDGGALRGHALTDPNSTQSRPLR